DGQWDTSNVWFENGRIRLYDKRQRQRQMQHIDWGLSMIRGDALAVRPPGEPFDLGDLYSDLSRADRLAGYEVTTRFYEIGFTDSAMIGSGSMPVSAMRPAKTETKQGAPPFTASTTPCTCSSVNSAVTLSAIPSCDSFFTSGNALWRLVFVIGILTETCLPQV